jgi:hypothetical protein
MLKRIFPLLVLSLLPLFAAAQLFIPVDDDPFGVPIRFNADSIRKNKIKSITASLQYKPDEHKIDDKGLKEFYRFDSLGRISFYWRTKVKEYRTNVTVHPAVYRKGRRVRNAWTEFKNEYVYDSTFIYYYYDYQQRLVCRRSSDGDFYRTWYYIYNTDGTVARQTHVRETNIGPDHRSFRLGVQTIISQEDFAYQRFSDTQVKQLCLNDEGKAYKETMQLYDKQGRPIDFREAYMAGGIRITTTWEYDEQNRIAATTYTSNAGDPLADRTEYKYDSLGRPESVKRFHNTVLKHEFSYLYKENAPIAYAYINRRHIELGIDIVKLEIVYW